MPTARHAPSAARRVGVIAAAFFMAGMLNAGPASADNCPASDFSREVDAAGEALRQFNTSMAPELQLRIRQLKAAKGWSDADAETLAQDYLFDARIAGLDRKANDLLTKLDDLGSAGEQGSADCAKLNELKATGVELLAVMKAKSTYTLAKIDDEIAAGRGVARPQPGATADLRLPEGEPSDIVAAPKDLVKPQATAPPNEKQAAKPKPAPKPTPAQAGKTAAAAPANRAAPKVEAWETTTEHSPDAAAPRIEVGPNGSGEPGNWQPPGDLALNAPPPGDGETADMQQLPPPGSFTTTDEGYTIEEIRDATRGFFGSVSTNLATVMEHAFRQWGQPTGYVLGKEGGGAFLAGLRYGEGTVFMRSGAQRKVYWHGPSLGYDFGAEGSRTLFLIYSLKNPEGLYRTFTGVDGSAYLVGGVGVTLLKGGPVIMAPIRSGLGLRIGANIGYLRFSPEPSWNPF